MKKSLQKFTSSLLTVITALVLTGGGLASSAHAGQLTESKATLSDVRSATSSNHTISFKVASTTTIKGVKIQYRIDASTTATVPTSLVTTAATIGTSTIGGNTITGWTSTLTTNGQVTLTDSTGAVSLSAGDTASIILQGLTNNSTSGTCDGVTNSDTCFIRIFTYSDTGLTTLIDSSVTTYTVIDPISVTATVDPLLTFTVAAVSSGSVSSNDANVGSGTAVTSTPTSCPFANVAVGTAKLCQQSLSVSTNAQLGYTVYHKFLGTTPSTDLMTGTYSGNNIDPFTSAWGSASAFTTPSGSAKNVDSGWLGARTTNSNVAGFGTANFYGAPYVGASSGNIVMSSTGPDNGGTPTYVTLKLQVNAFQPADTYTGTMVYNVVASY